MFKRKEGVLVLIGPYEIIFGHECLAAIQAFLVKIVIKRASVENDIIFVITPAGAWQRETDSAFLR